jgi:hypothetical protein
VLLFADSAQMTAYRPSLLKLVPGANTTTVVVGPGFILITDAVRHRGDSSRMFDERLDIAAEISLAVQALAAHVPLEP